MAQSRGLTKPGVISPSGMRVVVLSSDYFSSMANQIELVLGYGSTKGLLYRIFKDATLEHLRKLKIRVAGDPRRTFLEDCVPQFVEMGLLTRASIKQIRGQDVFMEVCDSAFVGSNRGAKRPKCHPLSGILAATWSYLTGRDHDGFEGACAAMREAVCAFELTPSLAANTQVSLNQGWSPRIFPLTSSGQHR